MGSGKGRKYLLTGGGTGGHVTPALAIAGKLAEREPEAEFLYVGVKGKAEETLAPKAGFRIKFVRSLGFPGMKNLPALARFSIALMLGTAKAFFILLAYRPDLIIATGGYVAAPALFAAEVLRRLKILRPQIFVHEQNVVLGRLNKLAAAFADRVGASFPETMRYLQNGKGVYVGYPVRADLGIVSREEARQKLDLPDSAKVIFAFGGSQGSRTINRAVVDALPALLSDPDIYIIHGAGKRLAGSAYDGMADIEKRLDEIGKPDGADKRYIKSDFFYNIGDYYAAADLVICRGGAGTLTEICARGLASIVIPKANLPGDHQVANARSLQRADAAVVLYEGVDLLAGDAVESVDGAHLAEAANSLFKDREMIKSMGQNAASLYNPDILSNIADLIEALAEGRRPPEYETPAMPEPDRVLGLDSNSLDQLLRKIRSGGAKKLDDDERRLVLYKVDAYLASDSFILKARGARMAGLVEHIERAPALVCFAAGRRPDGAYDQTPIVRRDAFVGLGSLGVVTPAVVEALVAGLSDPYFETRTEAALAAAMLARRNGFAGELTPLLPRLYDLVKDRDYDPRIAAVTAIAEVAEDAGVVLEIWRGLYFDKIWRVREAVFEGMARLVERRLLAPETAKEEKGRVLITSSGYQMSYPLKRAYNLLLNTIRQAEEKK